MFDQVFTLAIRLFYSGLGPDPFTAHYFLVWGKEACSQNLQPYVNRTLNCTAFI